MELNNTEVDYWRQLDVFAPLNFKKEVTVIGVGASGSFITFLLGKIGCSKITVHDGDSVENHNLPNQVYGLEDVGKKKVEALARVMKSSTGIQVKGVAENFDEGNLRGIVFLLTDSMSSRKKIWESSIKFQANVDLLIETRMEAEGGRIYAIRPFIPKHIDAYEKTLYDDSQAVESPCTRRAIASTAAVLAGIAVSTMIEFVNNKKIPNEVIFSLSPLVVLRREF